MLTNFSRSPAPRARGTIIAHDSVVLIFAHDNRVLILRSLAAIIGDVWGKLGPRSTNATTAASRHRSTPLVSGALAGASRLTSPRHVRFTPITDVGRWLSVYEYTP